MTSCSKKDGGFLVQGLMCPPCTPFLENGDVNYDIIKRYVDHHVDFGVLNLFVTGTTGEGNSLTQSERKKVAEAWITAGKDRLKTILIHVGTGNLRDSQELAKHAQDIGADAISCVSPTYYKPETIDDYVSYMAQVAAAAPRLPFYLYDIDFITGLQFSMDEFFRLAKPRIPTLRGLKHTSPSFPSMNTLLMRHSDSQVFLGSDEVYLEALSIGIDVTICNSYLGHVLNRLKNAFDRGDIAAARLEQNRAIEVCNIRRKYGLSFPGGTKTILRAIGLDVGQPRSPLSPVSEATVDKVRKDLKAIGFFEWGLAKCS